MLSCMNNAIEAVTLRGVTTITLEAMKSEALEAIRADDTTGKPVGTIVKKKEVTLQDILLRRRDMGMLYISEAEALTGWCQTHLVVKVRSYASSAMILNIWQGSDQTPLATDAVSGGTDPITVSK